MAVYYEWDVELTTTVETAEHEVGEVLDHNHFDTFAEAKAFAASEPDEGCKYVIVLVRNADNGRAWAYMEYGRLPSVFVDAFDAPVSRVPERFITEVARSNHA